MCTVIFIVMFLFLALASLITLNHIFLNQFITEHRDTFKVRQKNIKEQCFGQFHSHNRMPKSKLVLYFNVDHCFSDTYGHIVVGHCLSDIYGQVIVVYPSECIHLHCCFTLQVNTDKME